MAAPRNIVASALLLAWSSADKAPSSLRGLSASSVLAEASASWVPLGWNRVAKDEGHELLIAHGDLEFCGQLCSNYRGCKSFAFCNDQCFLKDAAITAESPSIWNRHCSTYYRDDHAHTTRGPSTSAPGDSEGEAECDSFTSDMVTNELQQWSGNPEKSIRGSVEVTLCRNGKMLANMQVVGGHSEIIAVHIHHCEGGDSHQTRTAVLCTGPPVVNFCGSNAIGLIAVGTPYSGPCSAYDAAGSSVTKGMHGNAVQSNTANARELVQSIFENPDKYYVNVHTLASYTHWYPGHQGTCRGPLQPKVITTPAPATPVEKKCFDLYSEMDMNELQKWPGNPDSAASGYASFKLCTNGEMEASALVFGGKSQVIAMHVHRCEGGQSPQTRTSELCSGPPVLNFCGSNAAGLINAGTPYPVECAPYSEVGASHTVGMPGAFIVATNPSTTLAELVLDVVHHPELYYFNVHSFTSFNHWYPGDGVKGMCRGPVRLWLGK